MSVQDKTAKVLSPLYENAIFRRIRWWTSIRKQRDFSLLGNLTRRKFGSNPLIIMGDKSVQTAACFHIPTRVCNRSARARSTPLDRVDRLNVGPTKDSDRSDRLQVGSCRDPDRSDRLS